MPDYRWHSADVLQLAIVEETTVVVAVIFLEADTLSGLMDGTDRMTLELPAPLQRTLECANAAVSASVDVLSSVGGIKEWIERDLLSLDDSGIPIVSEVELKGFAPKLRVLRDAVHLAREVFAAVEFDLYRVEGETSPTAEVIEFASKLYTTLFGYGSDLMRLLPDDDEEVAAQLALSFPKGWLRVKEMRLNARDTNRRIRKEIGRAAHLWEGEASLPTRQTPAFNETSSKLTSEKELTDPSPRFWKQARPKSRQILRFLIDSGYQAKRTELIKRCWSEPRTPDTYRKGLTNLVTDLLKFAREARWNLQWTTTGKIEDQEVWLVVPEQTRNTDGTE